MMKHDFNKTIITGSPTALPVLKRTGIGTAVMNFTLKSEGMKKCEYFDVAVWGELAEKVYYTMKENERILVEGTLHRVNKGEGERSDFEIRANRIFSLEGAAYEVC